MSDNFFLKTPDGRDIPSSASKVGGIVLQLEGTNGVTLFTQTKATSLYKGFFTSSPGAVGTQASLDLSNLGGGLARVSMRWTINDGDTSSNEFDYGDITLGINGVSLESASGLTAYSHDDSGNNTTEVNGFPNNLTATGWVTTTNSSQLSTIYNSITNSSNTATFHLFDSDPNDNYFDFTKGIDSSMSEQESAPNAAPTLSSFTSLTGGVEDQYKSITHSDLLSASNAADSDGDPISFRVEAVSTGTLEKSVGGSWSSVTPGSTLIESNDTVRWRGATNANGTLNAFTLKAYDGDLTSFSAVQVTVQLSSANDSPSGSVTISGTATQAQQLTAANTLADADGLGTISYQWSRAGSAISGATSSTYTLVQADVGSAITVTASYTDDQGTAESVTSSATSAVANINDVPTGSLSISGVAQDNAELTASHTLVDPDGLGAIDYQWRRNGSLIPVAITNKYVLTKCDVGAAITVSAQYTDGYGASESIASSATSVVTNDNASSSRLNASTKASATCINSSPTGLVRLSGTARENEILTATNTLDDADGLGTITYQWNRNRASISGSTGSTYALTQADVGSSITVTASYTDGSGRSERMTSTTEYLVANADNPAVVTGNLSGTGVINGDPITGSLAATDLDGLTNGTIYSIQSNDQAANGSATIDSLSGSWRYLAKDDFAGTDNFFVSISDDLGGITRQLIDLTISGSEQSTPTPTPTPTPSPAPSSGAGGSGSGGGPALTPTPDALGDLKTKKSAPSPSQQVNDSSDTVINGLNSSEWSSLRKTEIRRLTANQLQSLSGQALALFKPAKIKAIGHDAVSGINAKAINQLSTRQVQAIRAKGLTSQQLSQFSLDTFKALKTKQFRQITPDAITGLTSRHLKTLSGKELSAFKPASFKAIDPDEISHLEPNALDDLKKRQVKAITDDQLAGLSQRQIKIADDFIEMLSSKQLQILSVFPDL